MRSHERCGEESGNRPSASDGGAGPDRARLERAARPGRDAHERRVAAAHAGPGDRNEALRGQLVALAHRHRRSGAGMIYLKLRPAGERMNHKRVERRYTEAGLQVRRRRRKKIPVADRQPLIRVTEPTQRGFVWS